MPLRLELGKDPEPETVERAARALKEGGVVLLPAEGIYGYHALADREEAVQSLRAFKGEVRLGFIGLIAHPRDAERWARLDPTARSLIRAHWPGALTLVLEALPAAPSSLKATDGTVAIRCPGSAFLRRVVEAAEGVVLSTSANAPGHPPAVRIQEATVQGLTLVVDGGTLSGIPSTIARVEQDRVTVLRSGAVALPEGELDAPSEGP